MIVVQNIWGAILDAQFDCDIRFPIDPRLGRAQVNVRSI